MNEWDGCPGICHTPCNWDTEVMMAMMTIVIEMVTKTGLLWHGYGREQLLDGQLVPGQKPWRVSFPYRLEKRIRSIQKGTKNRIIGCSIFQDLAAATTLAPLAPALRRTPRSAIYNIICHWHINHMLLKLSWVDWKHSGVQQHRDLLRRREGFRRVLVRQLLHQPGHQITMLCIFYLYK